MSATVHMIPRVQPITHRSHTYPYTQFSLSLSLPLTPYDGRYSEENPGSLSQRRGEMSRATMYSISQKLEISREKHYDIDIRRHIKLGIISRICKKN